MNKRIVFFFAASLLISCGESERFRSLTGEGEATREEERGPQKADSPGEKQDEAVRPSLEEAPAEEDDERVMICHEPQGNPTNLIVLRNGLPGHLAHGDRLGKCPEREKERCR